MIGGALAGFEGACIAFSDRVSQPRFLLTKPQQFCRIPPTLYSLMDSDPSGEGDDQAGDDQRVARLASLQSRFKGLFHGNLPVGRRIRQESLPIHTEFLSVMEDAGWILLGSCLGIHRRARRRVVLEPGSGS